MPILVLVARQSMQVENGVDLLLGAQVDDSIEVLKALFLDFAPVETPNDLGNSSGEWLWTISMSLPPVIYCP
jgi:hypothetical protein